MSLWMHHARDTNDVMDAGYMRSMLVSRMIRDIFR